MVYKYKNAVMRVVYDYPTPPTRVTYCQACEVTIDGNEICVSYFENGKPVVYTGRQKRPEHFELFEKNKEAFNTATLHGSDYIPRAAFLEGSWRSTGASADEGFWSISLGEVETIN